MKLRINNSELKPYFQHKELLKKAGRLAKKLLKSRQYTKKEVLAVYEQLVQTPEDYEKDEVFGEIAELTLALQPIVPEKDMPFYSLRDEALPYQVFGEAGIGKNALDQMEVAMKLPVTVAGALMPDAHQGYGLPIGGVLATEADKIIPYAVGVDIACRMSLSVFDIESTYLEQRKPTFKNYLGEHTYFGIAAKNDQPLEDAIWEHPGWNTIPFVKSLLAKAQKQIGTSGTGNHFVEWGFLEVLENSADLAYLPKGKYVALLSHSGSRGFGANIANHYTQLAREMTGLPREAQHLAWLDLATAEGQEYWIAMNLAGAYAQACHQQIHRRLAKALGKKPLLTIENHHNFAWKEQLPNGQEVMVHRKGATPAHKGELGIIPASMLEPGFIVRGRGEKAALQSASHGAGRAMSRRKARNTFTMHEIKKQLQQKGIKLMGGDVDESPGAYKNINEVMNAQQDLVDILARFIPRVVRMAEAEQNKKGWEG